MIREDAMSSWARVILAVDWMARIRCLTARSCAPMLCLPRLLRLRLRRDAPDDRVPADLVLVQLAGGAYRLIDTGALAAQRAEELLFEPADVLDRHVVQVSRGARPHRD